MKLIAWLLTVAGIVAAFAAAAIGWQLLAEVDSRVLVAAGLTAASVILLVIAERMWQ